MEDAIVIKLTMNLTTQFTIIFFAIAENVDIYQEDILMPPLLLTYLDEKFSFCRSSKTARKIPNIAVQHPDTLNLFNFSTFIVFNQ